MTYNILFKENDLSIYVPAVLTLYEYGCLLVSTSDNQKIIEYVISEKDNNIFHNNVLMEFYIKTSVIKFDNNSKNVFEAFITKINNIINKSNNKLYYENGNIKYIGNCIFDENLNFQISNGIGTLFYDTYNLKIKYDGEFENGLIDGSGIFYMKYENITITAKNISNGIPQFTGILDIKYKEYSKSIIFDFNSIFEKFNYTTIKQQQKYIESDNFVYSIAKEKWDYIKPLDDCIFESLNNNDKIYFLYEKIKNIDEYNKKMFKNIKNNIEHVDKESLVWFTISLIIYFLIFCYCTYIYIIYKKFKLYIDLYSR